MPPRLFLILLGALLFTATRAAETTPIDGWPEWVREAMQVEARRLKFRSVETPDDSLRSKLPGKAAKPAAIEDGWYFLSDIKAESPLECYLFTSSRDLAALTSAIADANIEAVGQQGSIGNRQIYYADGGVVAGMPYLALEWLYTVQTDAQMLVGFTKVRAATKGEKAFVCAHNYLGYRESFAQAFDEFVSNAEVADDTPAPFYEEIARIDMNAPGASVSYIAYTADDEGDIRAYIAEATITAVDAATVTTNDAYTITYSLSSGELINAYSITAEDGEISANLSLNRGDDGDWVSSGTLQGKDLAYTIDGTQQPNSEWEQIAMARELFAGDEDVASALVWLPTLDPTRFVDATLRRDDAEVERQAIMTLGPLTYTGRFDASGNLADADMTVGPVALRIARIWSQGSVLR